MNKLYTLFFASLLFGCNSTTSRGKQDSAIASAVTAFELDERLKNADSLVVVFYKDPYGADSLRYTRYYTQVSVTGKKEISILQQELESSFSRHEKRRNCRGEGKIWCFRQQKIFQTLYFSTRCDDCCHLYLIKDGNFYYSVISSGMISWLAALKPLSREPQNAALENE